MKVSYKCIPRVLGAFFIAIFCFFIFNNNTLNVKAAGGSQQDVMDTTSKYIDDGVTDWQRSTNNMIGSIPISDHVSLDYTFGSARSSTGRVQAGDPTVGIDNITAGAGYNYGSKINVFINDNGNYYSIVHQGQKSYISGSPEKASDSSMDFALAKGSQNSFYSYFSVFSKMQNRVFMFGHEGSGTKKRTVLKVAGYLSGGNASGAYAEVVLRPSSTGAPIVQRELYVYNPSGASTKQFQVYFGEDTALTPDSTAFDSSANTNPDSIGDDVPLYAIGGGQGLYINSDKNTANSKAKLFVTNNVPDGFNDFMGLAFMSPYNWSTKGKTDASGSGDIISPSLKVGTNDSGDTADPAGTPLLFGKNASGGIFPVVGRNGEQNSAYTLRWKPTDDLAPGSTAHFASTIGSTVAPYAVPVVSKTYTNSNQVNGINHVGDKLHFTLKVSNEGLNSKWSFRNLVDTLPAGLQIDQDSAKYIWTYTSTTGSGSNIHDVEHIGGQGPINYASTANNQLNFTPNVALKDKSTYTVTFDASVTFDALNHLSNGSLTNDATFTGNNLNSNGTNLDSNRDYSDSVKIPIEIPKLKPTFNKSLRNTATPNSSFSTAATGEEGDVIEYQVQFKNTGSETLKSADFSDKLPEGVELVPGSVTLNGVAQSDLNIHLGAYPTNTPITIGFKAKINTPIGMTVTNIAKLDNVTGSTGRSYGSIESNGAVLTIKEPRPTMSFTSVPSLIDFGSINSDGSQRMLPNVRTDGKLLVNHTSDTPFQVTVSYDNNGATPIRSTDTNGVVTKLVNNNDNALYFNQANNSNLESWKPITANGIPIKTEGFSGSYTDKDLTDYVGLAKWKLLIPSNTKAGQYNGQITWGITDSM